MKPIYEFLIWDNCNNNCSFCFQREHPRLLSLKQKEQSLQCVIDYINSNLYIKGSHVLIVGGELFDNNNCEPILKNFWSKIKILLCANVIDLLYINTNLIYKDTRCLITFLDTFEDVFHRIKFTTSYDLEGRFKCQEDRDLMLTNMDYVVSRGFNVVCNTILTKKVCNSILDNTFDVAKFQKQHCCWVNLLPYIVYNKNLCCDQSHIFKALRCVQKQDSTYLSKYIPNINIIQPRVLNYYDKEKNTFIYCSCERATCGHSINFKKYSNNNTCFICDINKEFGVI